MFARLSIYENVDLAVADRLKQWADANGMGAFDHLPGYEGQMTLVDRDNARIVGIGFYSTAGDAREAEQILAKMPDRVREQLPEDIRPVLDQRPESVGLYEVLDRR